MRTPEELSDAITGEMAWRRRELSELLIAIDGAEGPARQLYLRSGVALLYAHWEGHIRACAGAFVEFLDAQQLQTAKLRENFVAMASAFRGKLSSVAESNKIKFRIDLIRELRRGEESQAKFHKRLIPSAESNLSSSILGEFLLAFGLDHTPYSLKTRLIDENLVRDRNRIAHGQHLMVDVQGYKKLHSEIISLMELFGNQIVNSVVQQEYLLPINTAS